MEPNNSQTIADAIDAVVPGYFKLYCQLLWQNAKTFFTLTFFWKVPAENVRGNENVRGVFWLIFWNLLLACLSLLRAAGSVLTLFAAIGMFLSGPVVCLFLLPKVRREALKTVNDAVNSIGAKDE